MHGKLFFFVLEYVHHSINEALSFSTYSQEENTSLLNKSLSHLFFYYFLLHRNDIKA